MRKDFFKVTIRQIKRNLRCARCKKEKCPIRYKQNIIIDGLHVTCDAEINKKIDQKINKRKKLSIKDLISNLQCVFCFEENCSAKYKREEKGYYTCKKIRDKKLDKMC